ncbi:albusnodin/ikarugamycin family macrolactam cyclase [Streptomyces sp. NPDC087658]|uniref:albusnodin/ikarugamycin family macrolactam cyclase n=1 Tax=Streptomyces sp. NPDC087658 TaxID=3365800 RepID=UPI003816C59C
MIFGGSTVPRCDSVRPEGAELVSDESSVWRMGGVPVRLAASQGGHRHVLVLGWCGATASELSCLTDDRLPTDIAWRWPGLYAVAEETPRGVVLHTEPSAALPIYVTVWRRGWVCSSSARRLARLISTGVDTQRIACSVLSPSVPALAGSRTFFTGVKQLAPGSRIELPTNGGSLRCSTRWRPDVIPGPPDRRLRDALSAAVALRVDTAPGLSCDLSGGLDSTTVTVLAASSLSGGQRLDAVTIHPAGNENGADLRYAQLASAAYPDRINHHLLPLTSQHLPYTRISAVPATDEPAPSTLTHSRPTSQLHWMHQHLGSRTHLTGDGGDSVLFQPPAHLSDLIRHRKLLRAVNETLGWARLRHRSVASLLREAAVMARTGRRDALTRVARGFAHPIPRGADRGGVAWFTLLPIPTWAEPAAVKLLADAASEAVDAEDPLPGLDASARTLVDEIREVARTAAADNEIAATCGIDLYNPFLDPRVMDAVLRTPIDLRPSVHTYKPVLSRAMRHLLPPAVAARTTKGSFNSDHYTGLRANLPDLLSLADGQLAGLGIIAPDRLRRHLCEAAAGIPMSLATIEQALSSEAWLRAHSEDRGPAWTDEPARSTHA